LLRVKRFLAVAADLLAVVVLEVEQVEEIADGRTIEWYIRIGIVRDGVREVIRANCIAPETILTERNRERIPSAQQDSLKELHPLKRLGTPEDVARAALFLASDEASWVTGIVFDVAGGAVMV
jgi:enoyl-[acyl-carrier-protein] reductase (NADH)